MRQEMSYPRSDDDYIEPSPPTKASLLKWWKVFSSKHNPPRPVGSVRPAPYQPPGRGLSGAQDGGGKVFGVSPEQSLKYASVAISMNGPNGQTYVYGYVPIVVAKCGMYLKETATAIEGIFRVSGSNKRINQLQAVFDSAPSYGKDLDWSPYSVHDAASVLRRYLNMMPEPVIPQDLYREFTGVLQHTQSEPDAVQAYKHLISLLPPTSRYLLLYLLDFLSVFVRFSSQNLMTASNLAVVFQPGLVSTRREGASDALLGFPGFPGGHLPSSDKRGGGGLPETSEGGGVKAEEGKGEHGRGKEVLEFLIEQQEKFVFELEPPVRPQGGGVGEGYRGEAPEGRAAGGGGATDLGRRGSEKSVERRRLRKIHDGGNGKIKRSKTLPGSEGSRSGRGVPPQGGDQSSRSYHPPPSSSIPSPRSPPPSRSKKPKRESAAAAIDLSPPSRQSFSTQPQPRDQRDAGSPPPGSRPPPTTKDSPTEKGWSPWKGRSKSPG